jgi:integrase
VYRRADGVWVASIRAHGGDRLVAYARTRDEARAKVAELKEAKTSGAGLQKDGRRLTVGAYLDRWLEEVARPGVRYSTYLHYKQHLNLHVIPALGRIRLTELSPMHVQRLLNEKSKTGLNPRTVAHIRAVLRNALNHAVAWRLINHNAAELAQPPRLRPSPATFLSSGEAKDFIAAAKGHQLEAFIVVGASLGLRLGEVLGLRWEDVDFDGGSLSVRHALQRIDGKLQLVEPKSATSRRTIPLTGVAQLALRRRKAVQAQERIDAADWWQESGFVFTGATGRPLDASSAHRRFAKFMRENGLRKIRFHDLRHSCASLLMAQGVNPRVVADYLGHTSISLTLSTYSHTSVELLRGAADAMDAVFGPS